MGRFAQQVEPDRFQKVVRAAIFALLKDRDGGLTNQEVFLQFLDRHLGIPAETFTCSYQQWFEAEIENPGG